MFSKFVIDLDPISTATQIAYLLNKYNKLKTKYTSQLILSNDISYLIEIGGINECTADKKRKIIATIGNKQINNNTLLLKHLVVHKHFRNYGLATKLIKKSINLSKLQYAEIHVRSDNKACLQLVENLKFTYLRHIKKNSYVVLVLRRII